MSLYTMHENGLRSTQRFGNSKKTRRTARTNAKIRKMVRRRDRRNGQREASKDIGSTQED